jgi:hypothetical protein
MITSLIVFKMPEIYVKHLKIWQRCPTTVFEWIHSYFSVTNIWRVDDKKPNFSRGLPINSPQLLLSPGFNANTPTRPSRGPPHFQHPSGSPTVRFFR